MSQHSDLKQEANAALHQYIEHGRGAKGSTKAYNESGAKYDEYMDVLVYNGPSKAAETVADLLKKNFDAKILDVGAGTGRVGVELAKLGYKNVDAVDAAENLLEVARKKNIYGKIICQFVGSERLPLDNQSYDVVLTCGAIQENHIPLEAFLDFIRIVKPGGYIVTVFRAEAATAPWYKDGLEAFMSKLEETRQWKLQSRNIFPNSLADKDGLALVHLVL